jgi:SAM-dependent methyltransferase
MTLSTAVSPALFGRSRIDGRILRAIWAHHRKIRPTNWLHGLNYERCAELPFIIEALRPRFTQSLDYLDIGSGGESPLPTYLLVNTPWRISCVDKFEWLNAQRASAAAVTGSEDGNGRFSLIVQDFLETSLPPASFDVITNISVIEHFEGTSDSDAMAASAKLLRQGGLYILTTLMNDLFFKEFHVPRDVYGEAYTSKEVYYQRHYDVAAVERRLIAPTGLREVGRIYFGDFGFQAFEQVVQLPLPGPLKAVRALYKWATPLLAERFLTYRATPSSRAEMQMNTASGVIVIMTKD